MKKSSIVIAAILVIIIILGAIFLISTQNSAPAPAAPTTDQTPSAPIDQTSAPAAPVTETVAPKTVSVAINNFKFLPGTISINKGDRVVWTNNDSASHTITGDNGGPASATIASGQTYSYQFTATGSFSYHCSIHPMMKGTVVVN